MSNIILNGMAWASTIKDSIAQRHSEDRGQDLIEYAVLAGAIALVAFGAFLFVPLDQAFGAMGDKIAACVSFGTVGSGTCG